ncbi:MAG: hypothetical protein ABJN26_22695 [Stappiaceae bacterium]
MADLDIFLSVGGTANAKQETFVSSVEDRLRSEGLISHTVGRNTFSADAPIRTVEKLMDKCVGTIVIALERSYFSEGLEKRGGDKEQALANIRLPTPWNHIEAAMSYTRGLPILVLVEEGLKNEGLLEHGYDWYVQTVELDVSSLNGPEFNGVLASWKEKITQNAKQNNELITPDQHANPADQTIAQLIGGLKPAQLWGVMGTFAAVIAGAFAVGAKVIGN